MKKTPRPPPNKPLDAASARERALRLLARREHGARELTAKLRQRGADADTAEAAVSRLAERGLQSDDRYAETLARHRAGQGYGPLRIRAELAQAGIDRGRIEQVMEDLQADWAAQAAAIVERRFAGAAEDRETGLRAWRHLAGRGFSAGEIRAAVRGYDPEDPGGS